MNYGSIVISSGHGKYVRGASGIMDEVDEARQLVNVVAKELHARGVDVKVFHDNTSHDQSTNLDTIVNYHNAQTRDLDVSVHFNAYVETSKPMGTEVLYVTQSKLAGQVSAAIAQWCGFIDRGAKKRTDLFFLNNTEMPAILIEVCFVDSEADCEVYAQAFETICETIAYVLAGDGDDEILVPSDQVLFEATGTCSSFGGPDDEGVAEDEGLAFISSIGQAEHLFLPTQPSGTSGLARRLNPYVHYVACRWDYSVTSKDMLKGGEIALVRAPDTGIALTAFPADWGPNENTGRVADLSPGLMQDLGIGTDDVVEVVFPFRE